jgi:hypothetical protein
MDGGLAKRSAVSRWSLRVMVGLGVLASVTALWCYKLDYEARQRAQAAAREARLNALRAEAQRTQTEMRAAKVKSAERVARLYREIEDLGHIDEQVQTSFQRPPRMLENTKPRSEPTP